MKSKLHEQLSEEEYKRYSRHIMIDGFGREGQRKLQSATVFVAGVGGLGSAAATYLTLAGVGTIKICDADVVERSNLNRQFLHTEAMLGVNKAYSAQQALHVMNPHISVVGISEKITTESVATVVGQSDLIIDCLDNLTTRHVLNAYAAKSKIPFIFGSVAGMTGYVSFLHVPETPCLYCVFQHATMPDAFPIVGPVPGIIGCTQALEALKYLTHIGTSAKNVLLIFDGATATWKQIRIAKDPKCPICGT